MRAIVGFVACLVMCTQVWAISLADLTNKDAAGGLKEALTQGAAKAVDMLGKKDGFLKNSKVKIPMPEGLQQAEKLMRTFGMKKQADELIHIATRQLTVRPGRRLGAWRSQRIKVATDGEVTWMQLPLTFRVAPQTLDLLRPPTPAAERLAAASAGPAE